MSLAKGFNIQKATERKRTTNLLNRINVFLNSHTQKKRIFLNHLSKRIAFQCSQNGKITFSNGSVCFWIYQSVFVIQKPWAFSVYFVIIVQILTKSVRCDDNNSNSNDSSSSSSNGNQNNNQNQSHFNCSKLKMNAIMSFLRIHSEFNSCISNEDYVKFIETNLILGNLNSILVSIYWILKECHILFSLIFTTKWLERLWALLFGTMHRHTNWFRYGIQIN